MLAHSLEIKVAMGDEIKLKQFEFKHNMAFFCVI